MSKRGVQPEDAIRREFLRKLAQIIRKARRKRRKNKKK